jgi:hypothetical protein
MNCKLISISDDFFQSPLFRIISNATPALVTIAPNLSERPNYTHKYEKYLQDNPTPETPIRLLKQWLDQYLSSMPATTDEPRISPNLIDEVVRSISEDQVKKLSAIVHVMENEEFPKSIKFSFLINIIGGRAITDSHHNGNYQCGGTLGPVANQTINDAWDSINFIPGIDPTNIGLIMSDISQRISAFPEVLLSQAMESGHFENGEAVYRGEAFKTWGRELLKRQFIPPKDTLPPVKVSDEFLAAPFKKFSEWAIPQMEHAALDIILASVRHYLALCFVSATKPDQELQESGFHMPEKISKETATEVAGFINRYVKQGDIPGYDPELVCWTSDPNQSVNFETLIPLKVAYAYAIEQKLLIPSLALPHAKEAIDDWIKAQLHAPPYYVSICTLNEAMRELVITDPDSTPSLRCQLIKKLAEIKPRNVALAVIASTKEKDDDIVLNEIMSVHQELDSLHHTLQNGSLAEFYQSLDKSKFSSILVILVNGPLHFEESSLKRLQDMRETMIQNHPYSGDSHEKLERFQYLGEDFALDQLRKTLDGVERFRDLAPKLSEYADYHFLPATLYEIHSYVHTRYEQRHKETKDQDGLTKTYYLAKKYAIEAYFMDKKTTQKSLSFLPELTFGYPDGVKVACHQICRLNSPKSLDAFFKTLATDLVVKTLEELLRSIKISPSTYATPSLPSNPNEELTWTNCCELFKAVVEQAKTNLDKFSPIIEQLMKMMMFYFQTHIRSDESIRSEIKTKGMLEPHGSSYFEDTLKKLDAMKKDVHECYWALQSLNQDLAARFKKHLDDGLRHILLTTLEPAEIDLNYIIKLHQIVIGLDIGLATAIKVEESNRKEFKKTIKKTLARLSKDDQKEIQAALSDALLFFGVSIKKPPRFNISFFKKG